jgi:hypothetical protein
MLLQRMKPTFVELLPFLTGQMRIYDSCFFLTQAGDLSKRPKVLDEKKMGIGEPLPHLHHIHSGELDTNLKAVPLTHY